MLHQSITSLLIIVRLLLVEKTKGKLMSKEEKLRQARNELDDKIKAAVLHFAEESEALGIDGLDIDSSVMSVLSVLLAVTCIHHDFTKERFQHIMGQIYDQNKNKPTEDFRFHLPGVN